MDFKVKCVKYNADERNFTIGKVYEIKNGVLYNDRNYPFSSWSMGCCDYDKDVDIYALNDWFKEWYVFELVEEKKVFTKSDLKTGMFGVMECGKKFVIVNDNIVYQEGGFDYVSALNDDLEFIHKKIDKLWDGVESFHQLGDNIQFGDTKYGELVYDWKRDIIRELTIEEIEKEFGIKVKFERV